MSGFLNTLKAKTAPAKTPTSRMKLTVGGQVFTNFIDVTIERDLQNIAGRFNVVAVDQARLAAAFPAKGAKPPAPPAPLQAGLAATLAIDADTVLTGYLERVSWRQTATDITFRFTGRDKTGDLVECAAMPNGPAEFHGMTLLQVAQQVCQPFGISVKADVDVGAPFDRLALHPHDTALSCLEKAARQRSTLLVSDGVGGLLLTRGGTTRGPNPLRIGELIQEAEGDVDWSHRFSDYFVKGQTAKSRLGTAPALTSSVTPLAATPPVASVPATASAAEASAIMMTGHAIDPDITRWRPRVIMVRTQSGMSTVQEQAEWALRVAKGQANTLIYTVLDWRAGKSKTLWRPNQLVAVFDPFAGINGDMLIAGVTFRYSEDGMTTRLRLVGTTAYDLTNLPAKGRTRSTGGKTSSAAPLTSTVTPLTAP